MLKKPSPPLKGHLPKNIGWAYLLLLIGILSACGGQPPTVAPSLPPNTPAPTLTPTAFLDPGPYFTPLRQPPRDPATFIPPDQVGDFTLIQVNGFCHQSSGQSSTYTSPRSETLSLQCFYLANADYARAKLQTLMVGGTLSSDPLFYTDQGAESFLLGQVGAGFLYAWTHGRWYFMARSLQGRTALDTFMTQFPH
jgi:hypothetical protein